MLIIIYDMASLKFRWNVERSVLSVISSRSEVLAQTECPEGTSDREAVFLALDAVLATSRIKRPDLKGTHRVGLYNPYTAQVAVGSVPSTSSYSDASPIPVPADGLQALLEEDHIWIATRVLSPVELDYEKVNSSILAHEH